MTRLKNKDGCCLLFFSVWLIFHKNNKSVSAKIMTGLSLSTEKSQSIQLPTYSSCGAHIRSGDNNFFSVQVASTTVCMQWPTRVFVNQVNLYNFQLIQVVVLILEAAITIFFLFK